MHAKPVKPLAYQRPWGPTVDMIDPGKVAMQGVYQCCLMVWPSSAKIWDEGGAGGCEHVYLRLTKWTHKKQYVVENLKV